MSKQKAVTSRYFYILYTHIPAFLNTALNSACQLKPPKKLFILEKKNPAVNGFSSLIWANSINHKFPYGVWRVRGIRSSSPLCCGSACTGQHTLRWLGESPAVFKVQLPSVHISALVTGHQLTSRATDGPTLGRWTCPTQLQPQPHPWAQFHGLNTPICKLCEAYHTVQYCVMMG